jgi:hypothetical protein
MKKLIILFVFLVSHLNMFSQVSLPFINDVTTIAWNSPPDITVEIGTADHIVIDTIMFSLINNMHTTDIYFKMKVNGPTIDPYYLDTLIQHIGTLPDTSMPGYSVRLILGEHNGDTTFVQVSTPITFDSVYVDKYASIDEVVKNPHQVQVTKENIEITFDDNKKHEVKLFDTTGRLLGSYESYIKEQIPIPNTHGMYMILWIDNRFFEKIPVVLY